MSIDQAERQIRNGSNVGLLAAAITFLVVLAAQYMRIDVHEYWRDPFNSIDPVIIAVLALVLRYRRSRAAALILFVDNVGSAALIAYETGHPPNYLLRAACLYFYFQAFRGASAYHRLRRQADPDYRAVARWQYFVWPPVVVGFLLVLALGLAGILGYATPTEVLAGRKVSESDRADLRADGIIDHDEEILFLYPEGIWSVREAGSLLTDRRAISYEHDENGELVVEAAAYEEIDSVIVEERGDFLNVTWILVTTQDGNLFYLLASTDDGGDLEFAQALRHQWKQARRKLQNEPAADN